MRRDFTVSPPLESIPVENGIVVLKGYGLDVRVDRGRLLLQDGVAQKRRQTRFTKATCGIHRLVILGHTGSISFEAIRWLHDIGAAIVHIDADGQVLFSSSSFKETYPSLRRSQVMALDKPLGLAITKKLLAKKLRGQAELAEELATKDEAQSILDLKEQLDGTDNYPQMRNIEAKCALIYWSVWKGVKVRFARRDQRGIPEHWRQFVQRVSPLTSSPRNAANPANALLNYLYAILEAETRIACLTVGLDPGLGFLHADQRGRDSLVLDLMEPIRPKVDRWLLDLLNISHFRRKDFFERRDGTVRISSKITSRLAPSSSIWAKAIAPVTEWVARSLNRGDIGAEDAERLPKSARIATPLTQSRRSYGRDPYRIETQKKKRSSKVQHKSCPECGKPISLSGGEFCSKRCWDSYNKAVVTPKLAEVGPKHLAILRKDGKDPSHGGETARKRGRSNAKRARERKQWEKKHPDVDLEKLKDKYRREILPELENIPLSKIIEATGFSKRYASMVRRDLYTPHPMHYENLERLIMLYNESSGG